MKSALPWDLRSFALFLAVQYADHDTGAEIFASDGRIARDIRESESTIIRLRKRLARAGIYLPNGFSKRPGHEHRPTHRLDFAGLQSFKPEGSPSSTKRAEAARVRESKPEIKQLRREKATQREAARKAAREAARRDTEFQFAAPTNTTVLPDQHDGAAPTNTTVLPDQHDGAAPSIDRSSTPRRGYREGRARGPERAEHARCRPPCGDRICVSVTTHRLLRGKYGGLDPYAADAALDVFYAEVRASLDPDIKITETSWKFWDAQFNAYFGGPLQGKEKTVGNRATTEHWLETTRKATA